MDHERTARATRIFRARMALTRALAAVDEAAEIIGGDSVSIAINLTSLGVSIRENEEQIAALKVVP